MKQKRPEKYSERFDNDKSSIGNPETWGKRVLTEEDIFNQRDIDAVTDYINKEQQKQHLIDIMQKDEELGLYDEPKQETLEEAAERIYPDCNNVIRQMAKETFINGAKWQQEQIGKSEFLQRLRGTLSDAEARRLIFETFKNK